MPAGAQIILYNSTTDIGNGNAVPVYLNSSATGEPVVIPNGQTAVFNWTGTTWTNSVSGTGTSPRPVPPTSLRILN
jgi:hypothetical protein